ncbi:Potassium channel SKOR [Platanthera guangdongensis]|uniref:Potassium channel SKOR n=1 Tax=Platanthera guangdongensis TaxID=2320717 RepID=A0ABR2M857_9ASPA
MNIRWCLLRFHPPALRNAPKSSVWRSHLPPPIRTLRFHPPDRSATAKPNEHIASPREHEDKVKYLIQRKAEVNCIDKFGHSPLLEAVKADHDKVAKLLQENGAVLNLEDAGTYLCRIAAHNKVDMLRRLLGHGIDPNHRNYDHRTPLHVAAAGLREENPNARSLSIDMVSEQASASTRRYATVSSRPLLACPWLKPPLPSCRGRYVPPLSHSAVAAFL